MMHSRISLAAALIAGSIALPGAGQAQTADNTVILAGGCFWSVEKDFDHVPGVTETVSGYIGGDRDNPTYRNHEGFREAVRVTFDPAKTDYATLVDTFWRTIDPTDANGQFCDRGYSYSTAVYAENAEEAEIATASRARAQEALGQEITSEIVTGEKFWPAEDYHQDFYQKNPAHYNAYRQACGRDARVEAVWGDEAMVHAQAQ